MLDLLVFGLVCVLLGVVVGGVLGVALSSHFHSVASKTPSPSLPSPTQALDGAKAAVNEAIKSAETAAAKVEAAVKS